MKSRSYIGAHSHLEHEIYMHLAIDDLPLTTERIMLLNFIINLEKYDHLCQVKKLNLGSQIAAQETQPAIRSSTSLRLQYFFFLPCPVIFCKTNSNGCVDANSGHTQAMARWLGL
jgi:hypothetical protein